MRCDTTNSNQYDEQTWAGGLSNVNQRTCNRAPRRTCEPTICENANGRVQADVYDYEMNVERMRMPLQASVRTRWSSTLRRALSSPNSMGASCAAGGPRLNCASTEKAGIKARIFEEVASDTISKRVPRNKQAMSSDSQDSKIHKQEYCSKLCRSSRPKSERRAKVATNKKGR